MSYPQPITRSRKNTSDGILSDKEAKNDIQDRMVWPLKY